MNIVFFTQYFPPETGAAPHRAYYFAKYLVGFGHSTTVITGLPNHPSGVVRPGYRRRIHLRERLDGIPVERCYLYASARKTFKTRLTNHLSFMVSAFAASIPKRGFDVALVTCPPPFLGLSALAFARSRGIPLVYDVRDFWPQAAAELGQLRQPILFKMVDRFNRFIYRKAAHLIAVTPGMKRDLIAKGFPERKITLITNGVNPAEFELSSERTGASTGPLAAVEENGTRVVYTGTHGLIHGMGTIVRAAERLKDEPGIRFVMIGDGVEKDGLIQMAAEKGLHTMDFFPSVSRAELPRVLAGADICLATLRDIPLSRAAVPVKMFDYMAAAKPIAGAMSGDPAEIVRKSGCGICVEPEDDEGLAAAILRLHRDEGERKRLGLNGRRYVESHYSREQLTRTLEGVLERVVQ